MVFRVKGAWNEIQIKTNLVIAQSLIGYKNLWMKLQIELDIQAYRLRPEPSYLPCNDLDLD